MELPTLIGLIGSGITIAAYAWVSMGRWSSTQLRYPLVNIVGTSMVLYSLLFAWNLPAVVLQVLWIIFSLVGIARNLAARRV